jgi:hypothetical protein
MGRSRKQAFFDRLWSATGAAAVTLACTNAFAQAPVAPMAPVAPAPPAARPGVVLLAQMTGDAVLDEHLRAAINAVVQRLGLRGFQIVPPATLGPALQACHGDFQVLRSSVNAELVVRVSARSFDATKATLDIAVLTAAGERAQAIEATPAEVDTKVPFAVEVLLPAGAGTVAPAAWSPPVAKDRVVLKDGTVVEGRIIAQSAGAFVVVEAADGRQQTISWDRISQVIPAGSAGAQPTAGGGQGPSTPASSGSWNKRAGSLLTFDLQALVVGILHRTDVPITKEFTSGETITLKGRADAGGGGGGVGAHLGFLQLSTPDASAGSTIVGFRLGTGIDFSYLGYASRSEAKIKGGLKDANGNVIIQGSATGGDTAWSSATTVMLPLQIGLQLGMGSYWGASRWSGVMLGIDYRPAYFYTKPSDPKDGFGGFNYLGFQLTLDVGSLEAARSTEANFRMSLALLPPVNDMPLFVTLGLGAAWY